MKKGLLFGVAIIGLSITFTPNVSLAENGSVPGGLKSAQIANTKQESNHTLKYKIQDNFGLDEKLTASAVEVIKKRLELCDVKNPEIKVQDYEISINLPNSNNLVQIKQLIPVQGNFQISATIDIATKEEDFGSIADNERILKNQRSFCYKLEKNIVISNQDIKSVEIAYDDMQIPFLRIKFKDEAKNRFAVFTQEHLNGQAALIFDDIVCCSPTISGVIQDGEVSCFLGQNQENEIKNKKLILDSGVLPIKLIPINQ